MTNNSLFLRPNNFCCVLWWDRSCSELNLSDASRVFFFLKQYMPLSFDIRFLNRIKKSYFNKELFLLYESVYSSISEYIVCCLLCQTTKAFLKMRIKTFQKNKFYWKIGENIVAIITVLNISLFGHFTWNELSYYIHLL